MSYNHLLSEGKIGTRVVKNRIVMSPMGENMANTDGSVSEQLIAYYARRAKGGTGIIIPGVFSVEYPRGKTESCQSRLDQVKYIKDISRMAREIHRYGALPIPQLHHAGASTDIHTTEGVLPISITENTELTDNTGAHVSSTTVEKVMTHVATTQDLKDLEQKFITAAVNAKAANCDGVELHGAHSYLIAQILHSVINNRTDEYGGPIENRARFAVNIVKGIREACGPDFIIGIRMPVHRWDSDGITDEESIKLAKMLEEAGCDFLDISGGIPERPSNLIETEAYEQGWRVDLSEKIKPHVNIPVFALGNIREPEVAEDVIARGSADYIVMGRQLICDPDYANKAAAGKGNEIRKCISCSKGCYGELSQHRFITCALNPETGYEHEICNFEKSYTKKHILVVGGGIAGMQAAITAKEKGYDVTILEKGDKLGGQIDLASMGPHKERLQWVSDWFCGEVERKHICVKLGVEADVETIKAYEADHVLIATGSVPFVPNIPGVEVAKNAWDVLDGTVKMPENSSAVVLGGGTVGCEIAEMLADKGNETHLVEMTEYIAMALEPFHRLHLLADFEEKDNLFVHTNTKVTGINDGIVKCNSADGELNLEGAFIVAAFGQRPTCAALIEELKKAEIPFDVIGDAVKPGNFMTATRDAYDITLSI